MDLSGKVFVTSDTHFGEPGICRRFGRNYDSHEEMDTALVDSINAVVGPDDLLLHLGDFVGDLKESRIRFARSMRERIACRRIVLLRGNHDPVDDEFDGLFSAVHDLLSLSTTSLPGHPDPLRIVLCHFPLRVWQGRHNGALHLHGHVHGTIMESGRSTDVGLDSWGGRPQLLDGIAGMLLARPIGFERIRTRAQPPRDHGREAMP